MTPKCHTCGHQFEVGAYAWSDSCVVIDADGARHEVRYYCDDCEGER